MHICMNLQEFTSKYAFFKYFFLVFRSKMNNFAAHFVNALQEH